MVITQPDNCQLCIHNQVCGIKQIVQNTKDRITSTIPTDRSGGELIEVTITCKYYRTNYGISNWGNITFDTGTVLCTNTSNSSIATTISTEDLSTQDVLNNLKSIKEKE